VPNATRDDIWDVPDGVLAAYFRHVFARQQARRQVVLSADLPALQLNNWTLLDPTARDVQITAALPGLALDRWDQLDPLRRQTKINAALGG
jgi:hypothetical protein